MLSSRSASALLSPLSLFTAQLCIQSPHQKLASSFNAFALSLGPHIHQGYPHLASCLLGCLPLLALPWFWGCYMFLGPLTGLPTLFTPNHKGLSPQNTMTLPPFYLKPHYLWVKSKFSLAGPLPSPPASLPPPQALSCLSPHIPQLPLPLYLLSHPSLSLE